MLLSAKKNQCFPVIGGILLSLDDEFGGVAQTNSSWMYRNGEISVVFPVLVSRGFPALLQGPSVVDRSRITEPLTHTAAALSQYCFKNTPRQPSAPYCQLGIKQDIPIVNRENS